MIRTSDVIDGDVHIRPVETTDLTSLVALDAAIFQGLAYPRFVLRQLFDLHRDWWLVADHPEGLRGYSLGVPTFDGRFAWLLGLGVRREFRGRGYGRSLTVNSLRLLETAGVHDVYLTVEPANQGAIELYREVGFKVTALSKDYFGPGNDRIVMTARL
jgi:ribosomal-protein-alanine N-acetyltransferase